MNQHFKTTLEAILTIQPNGYQDNALKRICFSLVCNAIQGDLKSIEFIRDTIGQQPFKEMILNEYATNPSIEKLNCILDGIRDQAEKVTILDGTISEEDRLPLDFYNKALKDFGLDKVKAYTYENRALYGLQDLADQIMEDVKEDDTL